MSRFSRTTPDQPLWHIRGYDREISPAGRRYWWNHGTSPPGGAVVQFSVAGQILYRNRERQIDVPPGSFILFNYGQNCHYGQPAPLAEPYVCHWFSIFGAGVTDHFSSLIARHGPVHTVGHDHPLVVEHDQLLTRAAAEHPTEPVAFARLIHHFVMNLHEWAELRLSEKLTPVQAAVQSILRQPHQPRSLKEIAAAFDVSREHLSRVFRQTVGRSAQGVLAEAKCQRALALLRQTGLPLSDVARQAGYANPHSLARHVRDATGRSPTAYRERA